MIPHALEGGYKVTSWRYDGFWAEIGSLKSFYDINLALAMPDAPLSVDAIHRGILSRGAAPPCVISRVAANPLATLLPGPAVDTGRHGWHGEVVASVR